MPGLSQDLLERSTGRSAIHHLDEEACGEGDAQRNGRGRRRVDHVVEENRKKGQARDYRSHDGPRLCAGLTSDPEMTDADRCIDEEEPGAAHGGNSAQGEDQDEHEDQARGDEEPLHVTTPGAYG